MFLHEKFGAPRLKNNKVKDNLRIFALVWFGMVSLGLVWFGLEWCGRWILSRCNSIQSLELLF